MKKTDRIVLALAIVLLSLVVSVSIAEPPVSLFRGGEEDGFDTNISTNSIIPPLPPAGTVIAIR